MAQNDVEEEEDYMSDAILSKCADTRPGLLPNRVAKQFKKEVLHKTLNTLHREKNKSRQVLETEQREEGLKNALPSDNKGFKLLEKMGYKPGTAIGKSGIGRTEPVPLNVKTSRSGLGEVSERKRRLEEQKAMRMLMAQKRMKHEVEWRQNVRAKVVNRELERDLEQSQKVCEQLDSEQGIEVPERKFYWPSVRLPQKDEDEDEEVDEEDDEGFDEDDLLPANDKLQMLTEYLRSTYRYCVWCGTAFNDDNDMRSSCPGDSAEDH